MREEVRHGFPLSLRSESTTPRGPIKCVASTNFFDLRDAADVPAADSACDSLTIEPRLSRTGELPATLSRSITYHGSDDQTCIMSQQASLILSAYEQTKHSKY